jgi:hypothetical protein
MLLHDIATRAATQRRLSEQTPQRQRGFILEQCERVSQSLAFLFRRVFGGHFSFFRMFLRSLFFIHKKQAFLGIVEFSLLRGKKTKTHTKTHERTCDDEDVTTK